jgi:ribonuclease-3
MQDIKIFLDKNNIKYNNLALYEQAFVHRSYINENPKFEMGHNERLEFLGDAVMELIVTDFLYRKYEGHSEGDLTAYRAALVNTQTISTAASDFGLNDYLKLSKGESKDIGKARMTILADTYEALLGAMYLDSGYEACKQWVAKTLLPNTENIIENKLYKDAKSLVQEKAQEKLQLTPRYKVMSESGPDHDKIFVVGIFFNEELVAEGKGKSKQESETLAAKGALQKYGWE